MDLDLKNIKALIKIMRTEGVLSLKTSDIDLQLSHEALFPIKTPANTQNSTETTPEDLLAGFPPGILTDTQLAFYSAGGDPSEDPENQN